MPPLDRHGSYVPEPSSQELCLVDTDCPSDERCVQGQCASRAALQLAVEYRTLSGGGTP